MPAKKWVVRITKLLEKKILGLSKTEKGITCRCNIKFFAAEN